METFETQVEPKPTDAKPFFVCQRKDNGQFLWVAWKVWEDKHEVVEAYKFSSVPQIVDFFEWQDRDLDNYDIVKVDYVLTKVGSPYQRRASHLRYLSTGSARKP